MTHTTIYKGENTTFLKKESAARRSAVDLSAQALSKPGSRQTVIFNNPPHILAGGTVVTEREAAGPVGHYFDTVADDARMGQRTFESAEIRMITDAVLSAARKAGLSVSDLDLLLAGDLLNQITSSSYVARDLGIPYMGLYSACSTMSQTLAVGACFLNSGYFKNIACATASHFATAERQYRYPLEYGAQRPPYAQWTVTGAGCTILSSAPGNGPRITFATFGKVIDFGINDIANMGAAMAPASAIIDP